ncbi:hypothetical protein [Ferrimonas futtsuensis]|uniref:hypothetical protein n=1 Tax=Ferrimonas futtsuensis TaxID=364764 RepID=UPI0003F5D2D8|nr:hypothetical protein [Ferrimonas futtsuensis]
MRNLFIIGCLTLLLAACGSDDNTPEPATSVTLDQANSVVLIAGAVDADSLAIAFRLANEDGLAITDAGSNFEVMYLGFPGEYDSSFDMPWHQAEQFVCVGGGVECGGDLIELEPGSYLFTPANLPELAQTMARLRYSIRVHGALASNTQELFDIPRS